MAIPENRVNVLEKDIEDFLYLHPEALILNNDVNIDRWIKRQFTVPSGIIDLLGVTEHGTIVLVEIKNVAIDASTLTQISRYAYDLDHIVGIISLGVIADEAPYPELIKVAVGRSVDDKTLREAEALGIQVHTFDVYIRLSLSPRVGWTTEFMEYQRNRYNELAQDDDLNAAIELHNDSFLEAQERFREMAYGPVEDHDQEGIVVENAAELPPF
jgi:hypothetical protein